MHRLPIATALLISFATAFGLCVWASSAVGVDLFPAQASPLQIRGFDSQQGGTGCLRARSCAGLKTESDYG
ncbi:hypothetical protein EFV37_35350 (plasmid) [Mesorhizobium loti]|nr:hypothetical protein EB229_35345 [Mesorhizobium jarvisii]QKD13470.1 hypothetical protein EFV37_35350 [Mesorhizobium loti]